MEAIVLRPELLEPLEQDAAQESRSINDLVNEAVARYLRERRRAQLGQEIAAYEVMHAELRQKYLGEWVAVYQQKLIDHDADDIALRRRVRARYGRATVLIREAQEQPIEEVWMRTPSTGKIQS